jgi:hypothetical protein
MKKRLTLQDKAERALKEAVREVVERHKKTGRPLSIWADGKVVRISPHSLPGIPVLNYFIFDVWVTSGIGFDAETKVLRRIQIAETKSLYNFARVITEAFGFYFDHCFGFYDNFDRYHDSKKAYELFVDIGEEPSSPGTKGVKKTRIRQAFKKPGDKMLFFFDYGDGWRFTVELKEIRQAEKWDLKPVILESVGQAPMQYPPCEEDDRGEPGQE